MSAAGRVRRAVGAAVVAWASAAAADPDDRMEFGHRFDAEFRGCYARAQRFEASLSTRVELRARLYRRAAAVGFERAEGPASSESVALIALYVDFDGLVVHVARQEPDGKWRSKIGVLEDIEHDAPDALEGGEYGSVACVLRRPRR